MFGEIKSKMVQIFGTAPGHVAVDASGTWRSVTVTDAGGLTTTEPSSFYPHAGSLRHLPVAAVYEVLSSPLVETTKEHIMWATIPFHVRFGADDTVTAGPNDPLILPNTMISFVPNHGNWIAVVKSTLLVPVPADGVFFVFQSEY